MIHFLFILFLALPNISWGQKYLIGDREDGDASDPLYDGDVRSNKDNKDEFKSFLSASPHLGIRKYRLNSNNSASIDFSAIQYGTSVNFQTNKTEDLMLGGNFNTTFVKYSDIGSVSPASVAGNASSIETFLGLRFWESRLIGKLYFQFNYLFYKDNYESTTPLQIVDQEFHSIGIGIFAKKQLRNRRILHINATFNPSFSYSENTSSGTLDKNILLRWDIQYILPYKNQWRFVLGHQGQLQTLKFTGVSDSSRNLQGAQIKHSALSLSAGLAYVF